MSSAPLDMYAPARIINGEVVPGSISPIMESTSDDARGSVNLAVTSNDVEAFAAQPSGDGYLPYITLISRDNTLSNFSASNYPSSDYASSHSNDSSNESELSDVGGTYLGCLYDLEIDFSAPITTAPPATPDEKSTAASPSPYKPFIRSNNPSVSPSVSRFLFASPIEHNESHPNHPVLSTGNTNDKPCGRCIKIQVADSNHQCEGGYPCVSCIQVGIYVEKCLEGLGVMPSLGRMDAKAGKIREGDPAD